VAVGFKNGLDAAVVLNPSNKGERIAWDDEATLITIGDH
jgi:hypothetical protein